MPSPRSRTATFMPRFARLIAVSSPTGPAPMMITSKCFPVRDPIMAIFRGRETSLLRETKVDDGEIEKWNRGMRIIACPVKGGIPKFRLPRSVDLELLQYARLMDIGGFPT